MKFNIKDDIGVIKTLVFTLLNVPGSTHLKGCVSDLTILVHLYEAQLIKAVGPLFAVLP